MNDDNFSDEYWERLWRRFLRVGRLEGFVVGVVFGFFVAMAMLAS